MVLSNKNFTSFLILIYLCCLYNINIHAQSHCKIDALIFVVPDFCDPSNYILHAQHSGPHVDPVTFFWSTSETTEDIIVPGGAGTYSVTVTDAVGCTASDDVVIDDPSQLFYIIEAYNLCEGQQAQLIINWGFYEPPMGVTYLWSTGATTPIIDIPGAGTYSVTLTDPNTGCDVVITQDVTLLPTPMPVITGQNNICSGQPTELIATGGPFNSYSWDPPLSTTESMIVTEPGTYSVTVYNTEGCFGSDIFVVGSNGDVPILDGPAELCLGQNGVINVTNSNLFTEFVWDTGETTSSISISTAGTYTVTVSDANGCSASASLIVSENTFSIMLSPINEVCGQDNGSIDLEISPPASYTYLWSNGATAQDLVNIPSGNYSVVVTNANNCTASASTLVGNTNNSFSISASSLPNTSCSSPNGSIDVSIAPAGTYSFLWSNGATTEDLVNLTAGTYTIVVTDVSSCSNSATFTINNNTSPPQLTITPFNASCGQNNGSIDLEVAPVGTYTYLWSNGATSQDLSNIPPGNYSVVVTDANDCIATVSANVGNDNNSFSITGVSIDNTSCTSPNGSIDVSIAPAGTYSFLWSNGATTEDLVNLTAGTYTIVVTDVSSCSNSATFTVTNNTSPPQLTITPSNTSCGQNNGSIDLEVSPAGSYTYLWSNGTTSQDLVNIAAGSYSVVVTSSSNCTATISTTVGNNNNSFSISGTSQVNTSCTAPNGGIDITVTPNGTYTYLWSNGAITEDLVNIAAGSYTVVVTDASTCSSSATFVVGDNTSSPLLTITPINASCGQNNGSIDLEVSPFGSYTYLWSNGATSQDLVNIAAGSYSVVVTSSSNCTATISTTVGNNNNSFSISGTSQVNTSCTAPNGGIDITVIPNGTYTYLWSNGAITEDLVNIAAGSYTVVVTDASTCSSSATFVVGDNTSSPQLTIAPINASCGQNNGSIDLEVSPAGSYTYLWSNGTTSQDLVNIAAGSYSVVVTSSSNCTATISTTVGNNNNSFSISGTSQVNTSCTAPNGGIDITVTPNGTYTYLWSNGAITEDLVNIAAGSYTVVVTDASTCSSSATFVVGDNTNSPQLTITPTNASCGQNNGSIDLEVSPAGSYTYLWSNGATSQDLVNIAAGSYSVVVTSSSNCTATISTTVGNNNNSFSISGTSQVNTSCTAPNGGIDITVTPNGTYTYLWSNGAITEDLVNIAAGSYTVVVTDASTCSSSATFVVGDNTSSPQLTIAPTNASCGQNNGSIDLEVSPVGSYTYLWSNGTTSQDLVNIAAGSFSVVVTSSSNCTATISTTVGNNNNSFSISGTSQVNTSCTAPNGGIDITVTPNGTYTYLWSNGAITEDMVNIAAGSYTVVVTDASTCSSSATFVVGDNTSSPLLTITPINASCGQNNGSIDLEVSPFGSYTYLWSNGTTSQDLVNIAAGSYSVVVTSSSNCTATISTTVGNNNNSFSISGTSQVNTSCTAPNGGIDITVTPNGTYTYVWSNGAITEDLVNIAAGSYTVVVTDASTCSSSATFVVGDNTSSPLLTITHINASCGQNNGSIDLEVSPAGSYTYLWSNGATSQDLVNIAAGSFSVVVTSSSNCTATISTVVQNVSTAFTISGTTQDNTSCTTPNGSADITITPSGSYEYNWSNGAKSEDIINVDGGTYAVTVSDPSKCKENQVFVIVVANNPPMADVSMIPNQCTNTGNVKIHPISDEILFFSLDGGLTFKSDTLFESLQPGEYEIIIKDIEGCVTTETLTIDEMPMYEVTSDTFITIKQNQEKIIEVNISNLDISKIEKVIWQPVQGLSFNSQSIQDLLKPKFIGTESINYKVQIILENGCDITSNIRIVFNDSVNIIAPNIIRNNENEVNSHFTLYAINGEIKEIDYLRIYDRWGNLMYINHHFEANNPSLGWNGKFNQEAVNPAVFTWIAQVVFLDGKNKIMKGDLTVIK